MTSEEFKQLSELAGKLEGFLGKRCAILPSGTLDLPTVAAYDSQGEMIAQEVGATIEQAVLILKARLIKIET